MEVEAAINSAARSVGLQVLKPTKRGAIRTFTSRCDVFVALHTGHGKSLCFVLLSLVFDCILGRSGSIVLCVSPLASLMMAAGEVWATWHIVYSSYLRNLPNQHTATTSYKGANYIPGSTRGIVIPQTLPSPPLPSPPPRACVYVRVYVCGWIWKPDYSYHLLVLTSHSVFYT